MFFRSSEKLDALMRKYQAIANTDPFKLRLLLAPQEIWRFFVDGCKQAKVKSLTECLVPDYLDYMMYSLRDLEASPAIIRKSKWKKIISYFHFTEEDLDKIQLNDLIFFNKGWFFFEKSEPGYLKSLYQAFDLIFSKQGALGLDFIFQLHRASTSDTANTNYALSKDTMGRGEIRQANVQFQVTLDTASIQGFIEFLMREYPYSGIAVNNEILIKYVNYFPEFKIVVDKKRSLKNDYPRLYTHLLGARNIVQLSETLMDLIHQNVIVSCRSELASNVAVTLRDYALRFIDNYHKSCAKNLTPMGKLRMIVRLIQDLEQLHMFDDANCRTLCMLLLNYLLINHGFPLCILDNPNCFDANSEDELIEKVIAGMEHTFTLIAREKLFGVKTEDLVAISRIPNNLGVEEPYLETLIGIERQARCRMLMERGMDVSDNAAPSYSRL